MCNAGTPALKGELTVRRPNDMVPTNFVMLMGHTIVSEGGCSSSRRVHRCLIAMIEAQLLFG